MDRDFLVANTSKTVETLFDLIGVVSAKDGDKACAFSKQLKSLGVGMYLTKFGDSLVRLCRTEERRAELTMVLREILREGVCLRSRLMSMRGRLNWSEIFAFDRVVNSAVKNFGVS